MDTRSVPTFARYLSIALLLLAAVTLIAFQIKPLGWIFLLISALSLCLTDKKYARDVLLLHISLAILGLTPITTDISYSHIAIMTGMLILAVAIPYVVSRYIYKDHHVRFPFHHGRSWYKSEILYIVITAGLSYLILPFYLSNTGAYLNWPSDIEGDAIIRLFIGTNGLGIWDELFFICTALGILRHYFPFYWANLFQAVLFTSFLYELGFTGWGPLMIFIFALLQGYIFNKTESLLYVITIHLTLDLVLFLALINAHHPEVLPIFIT